MIHLVLGGARSGKSSFALALCNERAAKRNLNKHFVAAATAFDGEMESRIARHQQERGDDWQLSETPLALIERIQQAQQGDLLLVDCLTLWLNNQLYHHPEQDIEQLFKVVAECLQTTPADVVLIANEVGLGVIPMGAVSRQFVDAAGWLNQAIARVADEVTFVAAGLPVVLKSAVPENDASE